MSKLTDWRKQHADHFEGVRTVVTGGAGFIGSHLAEALIELGAHVTILDDLSGGDTANLESFRAGAGERLVFREGSILDRALLDESVRGARTIFHQAALGSVPRSIAEPAAFHAANVDGTFEVLQAAREAGVARVVFAASSSAYGDSPTLPKVETMPTLPKSPYAASKVACEAMMRAWASSLDVDTACLRYFNIFGPRQNANSAYAAVIAAFASDLLQDKPPRIFGDGLQSRDFTFVDNAVQANLLAARCGNALGGEVFNVACGQRITVEQLARAMAALLGKSELEPVYLDERAGDVKHSLAALGKIEAALGYSPIVDFNKGLAATVAWYREELAGTT